jgi:hypothetical protein
MGNIKGVLQDLLDHIKKRSTVAQNTNVITTIPSEDEKKLSDAILLNYKKIADDKRKFLRMSIKLNEKHRILLINFSLLVKTKFFRAIFY